MKRLLYKTTIAVFTLSCFSLVSCKKSYLDKEPLGTTNEATLATKAGVNGLLVGAYYCLNNGWLYNSEYLWAEIPSDEAYFGSYGSASWGMEFFTFDPNFYIFNGKWGVIFTSVQRCNDVLRVLAKVPDGSITPEDALQLKAEAVFLRALFHFQGLRIFGHIPYLDETVSFENGNYNVSNTEPIWSKIEADFQFAADNLTETKPDAGRANSWAAKAFLAKTYMFEHKYAEAQPLLADIIAHGMTANGKKYGLVAKYEDNFDPATKNNEESVFAVQMDVHDGSGGDNGNIKSGAGYTGPYGGPIVTYGWLQPSFSLANSYKTDPVTGLPYVYTFNDADIKSDLNVASSDPYTPYDGTLDPRIDWTMGRRGIPYLDWGINPGNNWVSQQSTGGPYTNIKATAPQREPEAIENFSKAVNECLIRFADVLLWAAEVEVETGSLAQAETYVNMVRTRAANPDGFVHTYIDNNDPLKGFTNIPAANYKVGLYNGQFVANGQDFARESVRFERKLELAMENHRFYDLQRWDNGTGYMADVIEASHAHDVNIPGFLMEGRDQWLGGARFTKGKNEYFPIPQTQIDLSNTGTGAALVQNPGY
ncbi:MAG: RagB/SusD family nutrient uptake outer membrane protein [Bacteroidota bacterium]